jgi:uncharacterized repeat protein (TIGR04138 family)
MTEQAYLDRFHGTVTSDGRYPLEAYAFLHGGLQFATERVHGDRGEGASRHIDGRQLCEGLRDLALRTWGKMAGEVLALWKIRTTRDFGEMVFVLVNAGLLGAKETDRIEDFGDVFDFDVAFGQYEISLEAFDSARGG